MIENAPILLRPQPFAAIQKLFLKILCGNASGKNGETLFRNPAVRHDRARQCGFVGMDALDVERTAASDAVSIRYNCAHECWLVGPAKVVGEPPALAQLRRI